EADPPQLSALSSMTADRLTQGTRPYTAPELAAAAEALGGSLESGAGWGQSLVTITVLTPKLDAALGLVAEAALEPTFTQEEIDRLRTQTLDGLKVAYAKPSTLASLAAARLRRPRFQPRRKARRWRRSTCPAPGRPACRSHCPCRSAKAATGRSPTS